MPDVSRSDSLRSDTDSSRPRVSFNRDVHVKRIVRGENPVVLGALSGDGAGHLIPTPVRRERLAKLTKRQLEEEAAKVLNQAERVDCEATSGSVPDKYYTLPARRKQRRGSSDSQDTTLLRRHSEELSQSPPRKPPRTFVTPTKSNPVLNLFKRDKEHKGTNIRRTRSDASNLKSPDKASLIRKRSGSESDELGHVKTKKSQLSPIIEVVQREDYFSNQDANKENIEVAAPPRKKWEKPNKKLKTDSKTGIVIIDVDKAKDISNKSKRINATSIKNKLKSLSFRKENKSNKNILIDTTDSIKTNTNERNSKNDTKLADIGIEPPPKSPRIQEAIKILEQRSMLTKTTDMIHSSQQPPDKLPLTRGRKVDTMVKKLNTDKSFMPPKSNVMVTPTANIQHNNNQPFSYTQPRNISPDRSFRPKSPSSPIIYAQVVVQNGDPDNPGPNKQTIHTVYNGKKHLPHSDSDEGLGYEESNYRKYDAEKSYTRFGDDKTELYKDIDKFDEEFPITPKFKPFGNYTNGYNYVDSSVRGRGDGMDSKRRESLTELPMENGKSLPNINGRSDLSYRRDLLESRINSRRIGERITVNRLSPEYNRSPKVDTYVSEKTSRYYRHGSSSPVGYTEKYSSETKTDRVGEKFMAESRSRTQFGGDKNGTEYIRYDNEPKSLDSQASDYRSSPENLNSRKNYFIQRPESPNTFRNTNNRYKKSEKISKERNHYKSNPEINYYKYDDRNRFVSEAYHSSLRRQKHDSPNQNYRYSEEERKDKFGDSGIENDLRRDSGDRQRNDSEDEGFASSLLIAEKHNNEEVRKPRREYDSDKEGRIYGKEYGEYKRSTKHEYVHRERSIDDGSHYDPRIDKDVDNRNGRKVDKKPPKPVKKTSLEKVKSLFSGSKKKREKEDPIKMVREESLRARYTEYRGGDSRQSSRTGSRRELNSDSNQSYDYTNRRRLSTPSPSPTREIPGSKQDKDSQTSAGWFKSLDSRLSRKKEKSTQSERETITEDELTKPPATKNLRFFGDTDAESNDSLRYKSSLKPRSGVHGGRTSNRTRSQSNRDLHNISEEFRDSDDSTIRRTGQHKSLQNVNDVRGSRVSLKPPASPSRRSGPETRKEGVRRGRRGEVSSVESSTEGDSSQQSQRSVVYLHAATVGDIPGPGYLRNGRRAASREELSPRTIQPQVKTLSRSFSMLAPWKPRHPNETRDIDYSVPPSRISKTSGKTAKERSNKKLSENRKSNQNLTTLNRRTKSKENVSTLNRTSGSTTLYKKKDRVAKENSRYRSTHDDRRLSNKSMSVESLGRSGGRDGEGQVSRSVSMPRDPEKSAGWFSMTRNNKKKTAVSSQRL